MRLVTYNGTLTARRQRTESVRLTSLSIRQNLHPAHFRQMSLNQIRKNQINYLRFSDSRKDHPIRIRTSVIDSIHYMYLKGTVSAHELEQYYSWSQQPEHSATEFNRLAALPLSTLPPPTIVRTAGGFDVVDGAHRCALHLFSGSLEIDCKIHSRRLLRHKVLWAVVAR